MAKDDPQMKIRLPADVKEWLAEAARRNLRSQTAEIVLALREKMQTSAEVSKTDGAKA